MPTRDELGSVLLSCVREVRALLDHAHNVAMEEQGALLANDAEAIASSCVAQEEVMLKIAQADQKAAAAAERLAELDGNDSADTSSVEIARAAGPEHGPLLVEELHQVSQAAARVREINGMNSRLLSNGLEIIATCLQTVASDAQPLTYLDDANMASGRGMVLSLDSLA